MDQIRGRRGFITDAEADRIFRKAAAWDAVADGFAVACAIAALALAGLWFFGPGEGLAKGLWEAFVGR